MLKTVTVISDHDRATIDTESTCWQELQEVFDANGIMCEGMGAYEGLTQRPFTSPSDRLPDKNFYVFLFPVKVSSGTTWDPAESGEDEDDDDEDDDDSALEAVMEGEPLYL